MNKKKIFKILKIILIATAVLLVLTAAAGVGVYQFVVKPNSEKIIEAVESVINDEELLAEVSPYLENGETEEITGETEEQPEQASAEEGSAADGSENGTEPKVKNSVKTPKKSAGEYKNTYEYVKDNVAPSDFTKGASYASRIDVGYVLGLLSGGLTIEEKRELKKYLTERFSASEIADGISLYNKYSYLLK